MSICPGGIKPGNQFQFRVVQMEGVAVQLAIHLRVGQEDLGRAALGDDLQHP